MYSTFKISFSLQIVYHPSAIKSIYELTKFKKFILHGFHFIYTKQISSCTKTFIQYIKWMHAFFIQIQNPEVLLPAAIFIFIFPVDCLISLQPPPKCMPSRLLLVKLQKQTFILVTAMRAMNHLQTHTSRQVNLSLTQSSSKQIKKLTISFHLTNNNL